MLMSDTTAASTGQLTVANVDRRLIERLYGRFASVYDAMFGHLLHGGRIEAMRELPLNSGDEILEVGVGTGLTATLYPDDCRVMGIDLSESMLREAARHLALHGRRNIQLWRMDAGTFAFPDESLTSSMRRTSSAWCPQAGLEPISIRKVNTPRIWSLVRCLR